MTVSMTNLEMKGNEADATVSIAPAGGNPAQGMSMKYHLEQKGEKWVVVGKQDAAGEARTAAAALCRARRRERVRMGKQGRARRRRRAAGKMPSPEDLPPAKKQ